MRIIVKEIEFGIRRIIISEKNRSQIHMPQILFHQVFTPIIVETSRLQPLEHGERFIKTGNPVKTQKDDSHNNSEQDIRYQLVFIEELHVCTVNDSQKHARGEQDSTTADGENRQQGRNDGWPDNNLSGLPVSNYRQDGGTRHHNDGDEILARVQELVQAPSPNDGKKEIGRDDPEKNIQYLKVKPAAIHENRKKGSGDQIQHMRARLTLKDKDDNNVKYPCQIQFIKQLLHLAAPLSLDLAPDKRTHRYYEERQMDNSLEQWLGQHKENQT